MHIDTLQGLRPSVCAGEADRLAGTAAGLVGLMFLHHSSCARAYTRTQVRKHGRTNEQINRRAPHTKKERKNINVFIHVYIQVDSYNDK